MPKKDCKQKASSSGDTWFVYIVRCVDGSLYTGITKDVNRRCQQHNAGTASRYTRSHRPVTLIYQEVCHSQSSALKREAAIKAMDRREKFINGVGIAGPAPAYWLRKSCHEVLLVRNSLASNVACASRWRAFLAFDADLRLRLQESVAWHLPW
jgi:predicted GIY-YIG superfamily endonuclease